MILYRWRGAASNFGDELNTILWPRLLPGFFDEDPRVRFLGIGSILDQRHAAEPLKLVAGSGYGGYEGKPNLDSTWIIHWVRGPRTAAALGLPAGLALGDPAALVPPVLGITIGGPPAGGGDIGFMPHFESAVRGAWHSAAERAGLRLIDPRDPPLEVLRAIGACRLLLSEALHGVIVADALRVPWVAIRPRARIHRAKWADWAATADLVPRFHDIPFSTLGEWAGASRLGAWHGARSWLVRNDRRLHRLSPDRLVTKAALALARAARVAGQLSSDTALDRAQSRMRDAVHALTVNPYRTAGAGSRFSTPERTRALQHDADSAYLLKSIG